MSGLHGMLLCEGDTWRLYDLGSTNGTSIKCADNKIETVGDVSEVRPGDRLRFGAPLGADDTNVYWSAVTLLLTLDVGLSEELG